jgi:hypothetical protein
MTLTSSSGMVRIEGTSAGTGWPSSAACTLADREASRQ